MADAKTNMSFRIYSGGSLVRTEELSQDIIKIGKLPSSHLRLDDDNVSRMHAVIEASGPDEVYIIDLGSSSGTIVNGQKTNKAKLSSGDEIQLGDTKVIIEIGAAKAAAAVPAPAAAPPMAAAPPPPKAPQAPLPPPGPPKAPQAPAAAAPKANPFAQPLVNPFSAGASKGGHGHDDADEDPEMMQYGIVASGPPVNAAEVEENEQAIEVMVMWGDRSILNVDHLVPARTYTVGEPDDPKDSVDFLIGAEALGVSKFPVCVAVGSSVAAVIPADATGSIKVDGHSVQIEDARNQGKLQPCSELPGAMQYAVPAGGQVKVKWKNFTFVTTETKAGKKVGGGVNIDKRPLAYIGGSMAFFAILLTVVYFMPPSSSSLNVDMINQNSRLVQYLQEAEATEEEPPPEWMDESGEAAGGTGERHAGEEGQMGDETAERTDNRYAIQGDAAPEDAHMARAAAMEATRTAGILGTLAAMQGSWNAPTSPFGQATALGSDSMNALGALMGNQAGSNFGLGGLGLRGTGRGGGGTGEGTIGLGNFGTIGHGAGGGTGSGYGRGRGGLRGRSSSVPRIRSGTAEVRGSLSREVIRRVIRRHINEVRFCYEQELNARPDLEGRVKVKFIISPSGSVQTSMHAGGDLHNQRVESCIVSAVRRWTFPAPDGGGIVIVTYPFVLSQSGG